MSLFLKNIILVCLAGLKLGKFSIKVLAHVIDIEFSGFKNSIEGLTFLLLQILYH